MSCIRRDQGSVLGVAIERHAVYMPFLQADINTAWLVLRDFSRWPLFFFVLQFSPADISRRLARSTIIYCFLILPSTRARILLLALPPRPPPPPPVLHPAITNSQPHVLPFLSPFLPLRPLSSKKTQLFSMSVFTSATKIKKAKKADPTAFEETVAQALYDLQVNSDKLKGEYSPQLRALSFFRK